MADILPSFLGFLLHYKSNACFEKLHSDQHSLVFISVCHFFCQLLAQLNIGTLILLQVERPPESSPQQATSSYSCPFCGACFFLSAEFETTTYSCLVFAIDLDCWFSENEEWNCPQRTTNNWSTFLFTVNLLYPLCLVSGLEGRLNCLRI